MKLPGPAKKPPGGTCPSCLRVYTWGDVCWEHGLTPVRLVADMLKLPTPARPNSALLSLLEPKRDRKIPGMPDPLEEDVRYAVVDLLRGADYMVFDLEQGYRGGGEGHRTRVTLGTPDLLCLGYGHWLTVELKRRLGTMTPEQEALRARARAEGVYHAVWRTARHAVAWLQSPYVKGVR